MLRLAGAFLAGYRLAMGMAAFLAVLSALTAALMIRHGRALPKTPEVPQP